MEIHKTQLFGLNLDVCGTYYEGCSGDYETSPTPDMFEIESVLIEGKVEINEMLQNSYDLNLISWLYSLEQQVLNEQYR